MGLFKQIIIFNGMLFSSTKNEGILCMMILKKNCNVISKQNNNRKVRYKTVCIVQ